MKLLPECVLYGIIDTGYVTRERLPVITGELIKGGADIIQLRAKRESREEFLEIALELSPICRHAGIPLILNDHPELVQEAGASGAHVGQQDHSVAEARKLAGPGAIIGKSTHSLDQAIATSLEAPDYIGFGPIFKTPTKPDYLPIGIEQIREVHRIVLQPIFCIGGITLDTLSEVLASGAQRVVIVSDLLRSINPFERTAKCKALINRHAP